MKANFTAILTTVIFVLLFAVASKSQTNNNQETKQEKDRPVKIKSKPFAQTGGNCPNSAGSIVLRVTFEKSGKIMNIELVSSSNCESFDRSAIKAAGKIKFKPAIKDGEPITVVKTVSYSYRSY